VPRTRARVPPQGAIFEEAPGPLATTATWSRWLSVVTVVIGGGHLLAAPVVLIAAGVGFVAGVPHGAADHVIAMQLARGRRLAPVVAVYAGAAALAWALLRWADPAALVAVVALSALHFGLGELEVVHRLTGWRPATLPAVSIVIAGTGALVLPLARCGDQLEAVAAALSPGLATLIGWAPVPVGLVLVWLSAALVAVIAALRSGHPTVALDVVILGAVGLLVPPLLAFAMWFGGWHALRHCARMLTIEPGCATLVATGAARAAALRLVRLAALPSLAAWTALAALGWFLAATPNPTAVMAEALRLLLALTVPHAIVVAGADRTVRSAAAG
jgi:beta-carotene 15,15'-dioxygenase